MEFVVVDHDDMSTVGLDFSLSLMVGRRGESPTKGQGSSMAVMTGGKDEELVSKAISLLIGSRRCTRGSAGCAGEVC